MNSSREKETRKKDKNFKETTYAEKKGKGNFGFPERERKTSLLEENYYKEDTKKHDLENWDDYSWEYPEYLQQHEKKWQEDSEYRKNENELKEIKTALDDVHDYIIHQLVVSYNLYRTTKNLTELIPPFIQKNEKIIKEIKDEITGFFDAIDASNFQNITLKTNWIFYLTLLNSIVNLGLLVIIIFLLLK